MITEHDNESYYASEDEDDDPEDAEVSFKSSQVMSEPDEYSSSDEDTEADEHYQRAASLVSPNNRHGARNTKDKIKKLEDEMKVKFLELQELMEHMPAPEDLAHQAIRDAELYKADVHPVAGNKLTTHL